MLANEENSQELSDVLMLCGIGAWELQPESQQLKFSSTGLKYIKTNNSESISLSAFIEMVQAPFREALAVCFERLIKDKITFLDTFYLEDSTCLRVKGNSITKGNRTRIFGTIEGINYTQEKKIQLPINEVISNIHYKELYELHPLPIFIWEYDSLKIVDCNRQALLKYGYTKEEFLDLSLRDICPVDNVPSKDFYISKGPGKNGGHQVECQHHTKTGEVFYAKAYAQNIKIDSKYYIIELVTDFTDHVESEEQLLASLQELSDYRFALDESCLVLILNQDKKVDYLNLKFQQVTGFQSQEIVGNSPKAVYEENEFLKDCLKAVSKGKIWRGELKGRKSDGGIFWVDTVITPFKDNKGKTYQFIWIGYDITEKKQAEESLFKERFLLRTIIDNLPIRIYVKDKKGKHIINNKSQYNDFLGASTEEETLGKTVFDYFPQEVAERMTAIDHQILEAGNSVMNLEECYHNKNGEINWLLTNKAALKDASGKVVGLVGMTKDVTERKKEEAILKQLNQELIKKAKELEQSNQELEQFAYIASHDLQEPLRMITGFLGILDKKYSSVLDEKGKQYMYFVVDGATRMKEIIMDLLTYSRAGRLEEKIKETDLAELISKVLSLQQTLISQKKAIIEVGPMPLLSIPIAPIHQVFQNLINNSLKYQEDGVVPKVSITAMERDNFWEFLVKDNGIGIPESAKDKVFILFSRLHSKSKYAGTGIGLAMCKKIIENLGGSIGFHSNEEGGTTFYFTVPKLL